MDYRSNAIEPQLYSLLGFIDRCCQSGNTMDSRSHLLPKDLAEQCLVFAFDRGLVEAERCLDQIDEYFLIRGLSPIGKDLLLAKRLNEGR